MARIFKPRRLEERLSVSPHGGARCASAPATAGVCAFELALLRHEACLELLGAATLLVQLRVEAVEMRFSQPTAR